MKTGKHKSALREAFRRQRQVIFGRRRYLFHVAIWGLVFLYISLSTTEFSTGLKIGIFNSTIDRGDTIVINPEMVESGAVKTADSGINLTILTIGAVCGSLVAAVMVYFFLLFVIPFARHKRRKRYLWGGLFLNFIVWTAVLLSVVIVLTLVKKQMELIESDVALFIGIFAAVSMMLCAYFFAFYYFIDLYDQQKELNHYERVFTDKLQAETNFLKTQINPHFLFNTLNNIYSLTLSQSPDAPRVTSQLKELISYMVNDCAMDMVPLDGEVRFLENYIALEKVRNKQDHTAIELDVQGDTTGKEIAPLLLVNFIENAFKHGVKAGIGASFVRIGLYITDKMLVMEVGNSIPEEQERSQQLSKQDSSGIGIRNVKRRLELLYPDRYKLRIRRTKKEFNVHLSLQLTTYGA